MLVEFRLVLPFTVDEYQVGQLYTVAIGAKEKSDGDSQVEIVANEPYDNERGRGQYTEKIFRFGSKLPRLADALLPESAKMTLEKAWNAYPICHTEYTIPFMGERFFISLDSIHVEGDRGQSENIFNLPPERLSDRIVIHLDIGRDGQKTDFDKVIYDPANTQSEKTSRGPLKGDWISTTTPVMCAYKLAEIRFNMFGFQTKVENSVFNNQKNLLINFHKQVFCLLDSWHGMTMEDIRQLEDRIKRELEQSLGRVHSEEPLPITEDSFRDDTQSAKSMP